MEGDAVSRDLKRIKAQANGFKKQSEEKIENHNIDPTNLREEERKFNFTTSEEEKK